MAATSAAKRPALMPATIETEMSMNEETHSKIYHKNTKAKETKIFREGNKQQKQLQQTEPEQQLQLQFNNKQELDCNYYEFKLQTIPKVQNTNNDDDKTVCYYSTINNETITIDNVTTTNAETTTTSSYYLPKTSIVSTVGTSKQKMATANGCGVVGANCSNCRNIKILLRLSLRYFYDINCEFVKNII